MQMWVSQVLKKQLFLECGLIDGSQNLSNPTFGTKN